jgi:hypothetical protein
MINLERKKKATKETTRVWSFFLLFVLKSVERLNLKKQIKCIGVRILNTR